MKREPQDKTTILLADDHLVVRMGLSTIIDMERDLAVIGEAADGETAVRLERELAPDVTGMDLMMPGMGGADATAAIRRQNPSARILLLTTFGESADVRRALEAGATGAIVKDSTHEELLSAIRQTARGRRVMSPDIQRALLRADDAPRLSSRQIAILTYAAQGLITDAIAARLGIGPDCVKAHLRTAFSLLGASSRSEAVAIAIRKKLISP